MNTADARFCCGLARAAYREPAGCEQVVAGLGLRDFTFYTASSTQGFSCRDDARGVLSFRGSEQNPRDWIRNAQFHPVPGELGGHVHSGFRNALDEVWDEIASDVTGGSCRCS